MSRFVGFMCGKNQYGRWVPEKDLTACAIMGGSTVDFSQAVFTHPEITIHSKAFWGGVTIIVPPNVAVEQNGQAIMGGFAGSGGLYHSNSGRDPSTGASSSADITIKVNGTAMMGAINAVVNKKAAPAQLVTAEEAQRILREVPEEPSTTQQDLVEQTLGEVFGRLGERSGGTQAAALQQALGRQAQGPVVQGVPVDLRAVPTPGHARGEAVSAAPGNAPQKPGVEAGAPAAPLGAWKQELRELKELVDEGILSQEEFEAQKRRVLAQLAR